MTAAEEKWSGRIAAWQASGKSVREFAEAGGFALSTFESWLLRLKRLERERLNGSSPTTIAMARVVGSGAKREGARIVVEVRGARVVVERGFDVELLRAVVSALGGAR
jgi:hypothetical protein